jgi:hypothetical protein
VFLGKAQDIAGLRLDGGVGIGKFFAIQLHRTGGDKLFFEFAV